ncbi:hypothetical protein E2562_038447 [Oryza meyeriana var. granulata]|uniref:Uncharacterized protein n=1 Tax=Oryza meyeriana var. granulata TaxID=110450 RepID=A0A6G1EAV3_9ORYZ|nr:hypothetical protein E2562_038447 [Oryza meyeriana var. granulata]
MNGYCNLSTSPPAVASGAVEESEWEGVAVGAATLVRNFSSASQRFRAVERSKSTSSGGGGGGLQAVVRRAFSMRRQPSSFADGYWRIHDDMDGVAGDEHQEQEAYEGEQKRGEEQDVQDHATSKEKKIMKKKGRIFKACKKLLGF